MYKCHVHSAKLDPLSVVMQKKPDPIQIASTDISSINVSGNCSNSGLEIQNKNPADEFSNDLLQKREFQYFNDVSTLATPTKTKSHPNLHKYAMSTLDLHENDQKESCISNIFPVNPQRSDIEEIFFGSHKEYKGCISDALETNSFDEFLINDNPFNDIHENQSFLSELSATNGFEENFNLDLCDQNSTWKASYANHNLLQTCFAKNGGPIEKAPKVMKRSSCLF